MVTALLAPRPDSTGRGVEKKLTSIDRREEPCTVHLGSQGDNSIFHRSCSESLGQLTRMASTDHTKTGTVGICAGCEKSSDSPLKRCAKCQAVFYCSRKCQTTHWKTHKKTCNKPPTPTARGNGISDPGISNLDMFTYYNTVAHTIPEAQELAKSLNIPLPTGDNNGGIA
jgi:hypothetical protein